VLVDRWLWSRLRALTVTVPILLIDLAFFAANVAKIPHGGWFPIVVGLALVVQMTTWRRGRALVAQIIRRGQQPLAPFVASVRGRVARVPGTAIYMFKEPGSAPPAMVSNLAHNRVLHETTVVLSIATAEAPRVAEKDRADVEEVADGVYQVVLTFGFADEPDVLEELRHVELEPGRLLDADGATFFLGRETVTTTPAKSMSRWREELFVLLNRGAASASRFYRLPSSQVFEVGTQVDL